MQNNDKDELQIEKDIIAGLYKSTYLIYARRSTDEPDNQKNSLRYQKEESLKFAERQHLPIAPITLKYFCTNGLIAEKHSGFKHDNEVRISKAGFVQYHIKRPKFVKLLQYLSKQYFKGVIVLCWDRISRNRGDDTILRKLMKNGIDIQFISTKYDNSSAGEMHMDIDGMTAENHARRTQEAVINMTRNLRAKGICTYKAPIGYLNPGTMLNKPFDTERAPIIKQLFKLYDTGNWGIRSLARWANAQGMKTVPLRRRRTMEEMLEDTDDDEIPLEPISRPISPTYIQKILRNPFYIGKILNSDGTYIDSSSHKALISEKLFYSVQEKIQLKNKHIRYNQPLDLSGRKLIRCTNCNRVYTPYIKKKYQYLSAHCVANCSNSKRHFSMKIIEDAIGMIFKKMIFNNEEIEKIKSFSKSPKQELLDIHLEKEKKQKERELQKHKEDLAYLKSNKLSLLKIGVYSPEKLLEEETSLNIKIHKLTPQDENIPSLENIYAQSLQISELLKTLENKYALANSDEKSRIIEFIFSELSYSQKGLVYKYKLGYEFIDWRNVLLGAPKARFSEAYSNNNLEMIIKDLTTFLTQNPYSN